MFKQSTIFDDVVIAVDKDTDRLLLNKLRKPLTTSVSRGVVEIYDEVEGVFAKVKTLLPYVNDFELITTKERLQQYLLKVINNGVIAVDTETDGLDAISDRIAGFSIYTTGENPAYIPINHDYFDNNVSVETATWFFEQVVASNVKVIMHNARFDIRVLLNSFGVYVKCYFDTFVGAKLLNENENENSLKYLWTKYILKTNSEYFKYNDLFSGIKFTVFDPRRVVVYPALDALMTFNLFEFQYQFFDKSNPLCASQDLLDTSDLFFNIEMPIVHTAVDMEERGVSIDKKLAKELEERYSKDASRLQMEIQRSIMELMPTIRKNISGAEMNSLSNPVNLDSPKQLNIIFFRGLGVQIPQGKLRGKVGAVDKEALTYITETYSEYSHISSKLLEYKALVKIISTYLIAIPSMVNPKTNRLHTSWNTIGAGTGRFSSSTPNLQNIPSKNGEIRPMFIPKEGYVFVGADYSAQEPRILTELSQDPVLLDNYQHFKDIYSTLASMAYKLPYDACTKDTKDGKVRRNHGKVLQLALSYGMQVKALAMQLGISFEDAQELFQAFRDNMSVAFEYGEQVKRFCRTNGYIKTLWGRKRRFPDYRLPYFEFIGNMSKSDKATVTKKLMRTYRNERQEMVASMEQQYGVTIIDNTYKIRQCETQILNAQVQGSAADMTKVALVMVNYDEELMRLDARPVLAIHDELILECPIEHAEQAKKRLELLMVLSAQQRVSSVPFQVEGEVMERWRKD